MKYRLSKLIPVRMRSHYFIVAHGRPMFPEVATWWQWRDRIFHHHRDQDFDYQRERGAW